MTLSVKLALYNTCWRLVLIGALWLILPLLIHTLNDQYTADGLRALQQRTLDQINKTGIESLRTPGEESPSRSLLDEYILIRPYTRPTQKPLRPAVDRPQTGSERTGYRVLSRPIQVNGHQYLLEVGKRLPAVQELSQSFSRLVVGILGGILLLIFLVDLGYIRFLLRPLRWIITRKLRVIQDPEQFDFSPLATSTLELSQLDGHINDLMRQLNATFTREKAFASQASHELLTPIAVVRSRLDNLIADEQTPPHVAAGLVESQQTLGRLSKLVQKLLRLARIENHQYLKNDTVSIRAVLQEVLTNLDDHIALKDLVVTMAVDEDILLAPANQMLVYTLLLNLVGNAVRYTPPGGQVVIGRGPDRLHPTLRIRDTGPGMKPEQIATLTQHGRLKEATTEGTGSEQHNGIGLRLVRTIAGFHSIMIGVEAIPNQGTCIILTFMEGR
ncbi:sensor histidine kinase [Spirosoma fluviale]|uniref:histidine kinase n=1 Tax=Spirosoma fluviale TaxID=1597977 RepID=A0A286GBL9_9BACT|nr:HAMP domain-containing sensor histidine kinase [Spirosoma fluviale]SOD92901.1 Signal transduction histidine kinase [Spirosoma fluviale]